MDTKFQSITEISSTFFLIINWFLFNLFFFFCCGLSVGYRPLSYFLTTFDCKLCDDRLVPNISYIICGVAMLSWPWPSSNFVAPFFAVSSDVSFILSLWEWYMFSYVMSMVYLPNPVVGLTIFQCCSKISFHFQFIQFAIL